MKNQHKSLISFLLLILISSILFSQSATGSVFHDVNENGKKDPNEKGISKVCVSNGTEVVQTDSEGKWNLPITDDTGLFVIKPTDYSVAVNNDLGGNITLTNTPDLDSSIVIQRTLPLDRTVDYVSNGGIYASDIYGVPMDEIYIWGCNCSCQ